MPIESSSEQPHFTELILPEITVPEITMEQKTVLIEVAQKLNVMIPEAVIVGGAALRIHTLAQQLFTPAAIGRDVDVILTLQEYERYREVFAVSGEQPIAIPDIPIDELHRSMLLNAYRRRGFTEKGQHGTQVSFCDYPLENMALWDKQNKCHVDVFADEGASKAEITCSVEIDSIELRITRVEELYCRILLYITADLRLGIIQERRVLYLHMLQQIVDVATIDDLWFRVHGYAQDWREIAKEIESGFRSLPRQKIVHGPNDHRQPIFT